MRHSTIIFFLLLIQCMVKAQADNETRVYASVDPMWEINGGLLFGLTKNSNQSILKILWGRRIGK